MGFGDEIPKQVLGRQPYRLPKREASQKRESGSEALPDFANPSLNRREAEMGFGDEIPRQVFGIVVMRPQCGAYSMTEIGNRKKRKAFLYEFPGSAALSSPSLRAEPKSRTSKTRPAGRD